MPDCDGAGTDERSNPASEVKGGDEKSYPRPPSLEARGSGREELPHTPKPEAKGGSGEEQPHVQGAVAAQAQEGLEELSHIEGQEGRR